MEKLESNTGNQLHSALMSAGTVMALMRFRQGGFLRLPSDEPEPKKEFKSRRNMGYY
jgi:hypothetical protein